MSSLRVQQANAAVEDAVQDYSDENESELDENDGGDGVAIDDRLPIPASYNRTLLELYQLVKDERYMNINPDYQRDVVWSESRMIHLIESLFRNFYVPPLIFKVTTGTKPGTKERRRWRTCIDGKQRLTTIRKFFDGEIPFIDKRRQKWYYCDPSGTTRLSTRNIISAEEKDFINNVTIVNIEYEDLREDLEEDMFQRVQLGVPLTVAERLAALSGEVPDFIKRLRASYPGLVALVGSKRSTDHRLITQLVYLLHEHNRDGEDLKLSTSLPILAKFVSDQDYRRVLTPAFRAQVERVFTKYSCLVENHKELFTHVFGAVNATMRKFSPVEFLGVGVLLDTYPERPTRVLVQDIMGFREYLRARLHDLRSNTMTWTNVMEYITTLEDTRGYFPPDDDSGQAGKRPRTHPLLAPPRNPAWNPPPPEQRIPVLPASTLNEQQQRLHDARLASSQAEHRDAFTRLPPARPIAHQNTAQPAAYTPQIASPRTRQPPDYAGGVQERIVNGSRKRAFDGAPVKRESN